tara:strand:+ start:1129 stop:2760 length:1632 start_codon:yes stop_codon:yes gene_type:complete
MSSNNQKLSKKVYNNKEFTDIIDRDFSSLIKTQNPINVKRFFGLYRELFYKIDKYETSKSHYKLILESQDYLNNYIDWRDQVISDLIDKIGELQQILIDKQTREHQSHPMYPEGTFLRSPARNSNGLPLWIMQKGVKREIKNYNTYQSLKRAAGNQYEDNDDDVCRKLEISALDDILDGPPILDDNDINSKNWESTDLDITLQGITDYVEAELTCFEGSDDPNNMAPFNITQYQSRYSSCKVEYESLDINAPGSTKYITENIFPGDSKTIKYRNNNITFQSSLNVIEGFTQEKIIKDTGIAIGAPTSQDPYGNWKDENGNFAYRYYDLPGVPYSFKKYRDSSYGTKQIQPNSRNTDASWWLPYKDHAWMDADEQMIQDRLWEEVFNDPTNVYYNTSATWNGWSGPLGGLYGEPIYYLSSPLGELEGHNNMFVVKAGTNLESLDDTFNGNLLYQTQYYVILNKDFEPFNQLNRIKSSLDYQFGSSLQNLVGNAEYLSTLSTPEYNQIATNYQLPISIFTNNWWLTMSNPTRSNQKEAYPGFNRL